MFEALESRELMSATLPTADVGDPTAPTDPGTPDVTVEARKASSSSNSSGQIYLKFTFKLVAVKTVAW